MIQRSGNRFRRLYEALLSAFRYDELRMLVRFHLDLQLEEIAPPGTLSNVTFRLIEWAETHGRIGDLVRAARAQNPSNSLLAEIAKEFLPQETEPGSSFSYDVFISYHKKERPWVEHELLPRLEAAGLRTAVDFRDFRPGQARFSAIERAIETSRQTLAVVTPGWVEDEWSLLESLLSYTPAADAAARIVPILLQHGKFPLSIRHLAYLDFTDPQLREAGWPRLLASLGGTVPTPPSQSEAEGWHLDPGLVTDQFFVGREGEFGALDQWLKSDAHQPVMLVTGVGGVGKSSLVTQWLHGAVSSAEWPRVFSWSFNANPDFQAFMRAAREYLGQSNMPGRSRQSVETLLNALAQQRTLLVLDGCEALLATCAGAGSPSTADTPRAPAAGDVLADGRKAADPIAGAFLRQLAARQQSKILLTSRMRLRDLETDTGELLPGAQEIRLGPLPPAVALEMLRSLGLHGADAELARAAELYDHHPLGLTLLAGIAHVDAHAPGRISAPSVQIELDARSMERCKTVEAIGAARRQVTGGELDGPASALLRSFRRMSEDVDAARLQATAYNQRLALSGVESRLDGLILELQGSNQQYSTRFISIALQWRQVVGAQIQQLARAVELRQELDCPYVIAVPLTEQQEIFVGRAEIGARIEQLLLDRRRPPLLLYGQRRTGKTSLLFNLGRLLPSTMVPMFVDLQGPASLASDHSGFLYNLSRGMVESARRLRSVELPALTRESLAADPFTTFDEWLDRVEGALCDRTALLSLDEFERLDRAFTSGRFEEDAILGMLRNLIQHRPRFKVLLAGAHALGEFQRWSSYLINAQVIHIGYLKEDEARRLIEEPVPDFPLRYAPDASARVLQLTRGHPFLVQLLCAELVALKNEQDPAVRRLAHLEDVEEAVPRALDSGSMFFADVERNQVDAAGVAVLRALAARGEGYVAPVSELAPADGAPIAAALSMLQQRELIEPAGGGYRFQVEMIRQWFACDRE